MFCDIKNQLDNPDVLHIVAYSEYESSIERAKKKAAEFRRHESWQLYGWVENGEIGGVCGFEVHKDYVEILNIAVAENVRHHGIGGKKYGKSIAQLHKALKEVQNEVSPDEVNLYQSITGWALPNVRKQNIQWNMGLDEEFFKDYIDTFGKLFGKLPKQLIHRDPKSEQHPVL